MRRVYLFFFALIYFLFFTNVTCFHNLFTFGALVDGKFFRTCLLLIPRSEYTDIFLARRATVEKRVLQVRALCRNVRITIACNVQPAHTPYTRCDAVGTPCRSVAVAQYL